MPRESLEQTDKGSVLAWSTRAGLPRGGPGSGTLEVGGFLEEVNPFSTYSLGPAMCRIEAGVGDTGEREPRLLGSKEEQELGRRKEGSRTGRVEQQGWGWLSRRLRSLAQDSPVAGGLFLIFS